MIIEQAMMDDPVNGDNVKVNDPLDPSKTTTLNDIYKRLSKETLRKYPAPFETVNNIEDHVKIAESLYLDEEELKDYLYLEYKYKASV